MNIIYNQLNEKHKKVVEALLKRHNQYVESAWDEDQCLKVGRKRLLRLGEGSFSTVYALDDKWAVRLETQEENAYRRWAEFCVKNKNIHLPQIAFHAIVESDRAYEGLALTVVERLKPLSKLGDLDFEDYSAFSDACNGLEDSLQGYKHVRLKGFAALGVKINRPALRRLSKKIQVDGGFEVNDIHSGNIMLRDDGTMVLTDPVY